MVNRTWHGDKLYFLLELPYAKRDELFCKYLNYSKHTVKDKRKIYLRKVKDGSEPMPLKPSYFDEPASVIAERLGNLSSDGIVDELTRKSLHEELDKAINENNINPGNIGKIKITGGSHTGYIKNQEGEIEYTEPLKRKGFSFSIEARQIRPQLMRVTSQRLSKKESLKTPQDVRVCAIIPDLQIPMEDPQALSVALQIIQDVKPDKIVFLGDSLDLTAWSKYPQRPEHQQTTQGAIVRFHKIMASLRKTFPRAEIVALEGNHSLRMASKTAATNPEALYLTKANDLNGWPVMSVPYLTAMDELDVEYVAGYPANIHWINERLQVRHGHLVRSGGSTARAVSHHERVSTIFGHIHRQETHYKTVNTYGGGKTNLAHSPGCLCLIDGSVPSVKGGTDLKGNPVRSYEDWQQGISIVTYWEGDSPFYLEPVYINTFNNHEAMYRGKVYRPKQEILPYEP